MIEEKIYLKRLKPIDVTNEYVSWMNDPVISQFLESRHDSHDISSVKLFVETMSKDETNFLFGIFCSRTSKHIGNIKLGPVDYRYKRAEIGLIVGDTNYWGKGIATEAINGVCRYASDILKLNKLAAGCYASNIGSKKLFLKSGFIIEGTFLQHFILKGIPEDCIRFGKILPRKDEL
jgi:RimJ/RimL family protein N-acetyltransferase